MKESKITLLGWDRNKISAWQVLVMKELMSCFKGSCKFLWVLPVFVSLT